MTTQYIPTITIKMSTTGGLGSPYGSEVWTTIDVGTHVMAITCDVGTRHYTDIVSPCMFSMDVRNADGAFTPGNTSSPYHGAIRIGAPIWMTARVYPNYPSLSLFYDYNIWYGYVSEITVNRSRDPEKNTVRIDAIDIIGSFAYRRITYSSSAGWTPQQHVYYMFSDLLGGGGYGYATDTGGPFEDLCQSIEYIDVPFLDALRTICLTGNAIIRTLPALFLPGVVPWKVRYTSLQGLSGVNTLYLKPEHTPSFSPIKNVPYHRISPFSLHQGDIHNDIVAARIGGGNITVSDATSKTAYGIRTYSQGGLLFSSDASVTAFASYILARHKDPVYTIDWIEIDLGKVDTTPGNNYLDTFALVLWQQIFAAGKGLINIVIDGGTYLLVPMGVTHTITSVNSWIMRIHVAPLEWCGVP